MPLALISASQFRLPAFAMASKNERWLASVLEALSTRNQRKLPPLVYVPGRDGFVRLENIALMIDRAIQKRLSDTTSNFTTASNRIDLDAFPCDAIAVLLSRGVAVDLEGYAEAITDATSKRDEGDNDTPLLYGNMIPSIKEMFSSQTSGRFASEFQVELDKKCLYSYHYRKCKASSQQKNSSTAINQKENESRIIIISKIGAKLISGMASQSAYKKSLESDDGIPVSIEYISRDLSLDKVFLIRIMRLYPDPDLCNDELEDPSMWYSKSIFESKVRNAVLEILAPSSKLTTAVYVIKKK